MTSDLTGNWSIRLTPALAGAAAERLTLHIDRNASQGPYTVRLGDQAANAVTVRAEGAVEALEFACLRAGGRDWFCLRIAGAMLTGRYASGQDLMPPEAGYPHFVTGWNMSALSQSLWPRVFDLIEEAPAGAAQGVVRRRATLRLDCGADGQPLGRYKAYAVQRMDGAAYESEEGAEYDVEVTRWDGTHLGFVRRERGTALTYAGTVEGASVRGVAQNAGEAGAGFGWHGRRIGVLGYGLVAKSLEARTAWQARTRQALKHLTMAGAPTPHTVEVKVLRSQARPGSGQVPRDDNPAQHPPDYHLSELELTFTFADRSGRSVQRRCHAWLAEPDSLPAGARRRAALCLNGHRGSAYRMFFPGPERLERLYWYGDAFARRGYVVLALDLSHRPPEDRLGHYDDYDEGDDPQHGNHAHPAIRAEAGPASDWEEPGERAWDVTHAHDFLRSLPNVAPGQVVVAGLSMGGEVATLASALEPRIAVTIAAGYSPDLAVMQYHGNHAYWQWLAADMREYVAVSDLHALIAPRALIVPTSKQDIVFSNAAVPYAANLQVARRSRAAYSDAQRRFVHHLHDQRLYPHEFCVGDLNPYRPDLAAGLEIVSAEAPDRVSVAPLEGRTRPTLFDYLDNFWEEAATP